MGQPLEVGDHAVLGWDEAKQMMRCRGREVGVMMSQNWLWRMSDCLTVMVHVELRVDEGAGHRGEQLIRLIVRVTQPGTGMKTS